MAGISVGPSPPTCIGSVVLHALQGGQPSPQAEATALVAGATRVTLTEEEDTVVLKKKKKSARSKETSPAADPTISVTTRTATETTETATGTTAVSTSTTAVTVSTTGVGAGPGESVKSLAADPNWWGHKYGFVVGGALGEKQKKKEAGEEGKRGFLEQDQEDLYNLVQVSPN